MSVLYVILMVDDVRNAHIDADLASRFWKLAAVMAGQVGMGVAMIFRSRSLARKRREFYRTHCHGCNYDRTGLALGAVCPECGRAPD